MRLQEGDPNIKRGSTQIKCDLARFESQVRITVVFFLFLHEIELKTLIRGFIDEKIFHVIATKYFWTWTFWQFPTCDLLPLQVLYVSLSLQ